MTTATEPTALEELKAKQQQIWGSGDYGRVAWITVPIAHELVEAVDLRPGSRVLDVATGTGHVALQAARTFCDVTGIDYVPALIDVAAGTGNASIPAAQRGARVIASDLTPELLDAGRTRAEAQGLELEWIAADAEHLPFDDGMFDVVLSAIGVMFSADQHRAAGELVRVCRPGGRIGVASWTPAGFVGAMLKTVGKHVPPPPAAQPPSRWGTEETVAQLLGDQVQDVASVTASVTARFASAEAFADFFLTHYGPTYAAASRLDEAGRTAFRTDLVQLAHEANRAADGTFVSDWDYLVVTAEKR
jgi:ubiquinone/menaquinone biosynthesis C-methylase UbiE